ncbi:MAG: NAD(P)H-hydrate dehydratase [Candidatus Kapaibacteriota bacterium]
MKYILTPEEMRLADSKATEYYRVPSIVLMENAARSSANFIEQIIQKLKMNKAKFTFFCGSGNNGGDGFALARHLFDKYEIIIYWIGDEKKMSPETQTNFHSAIKLGIPTIKLETETEVENLDLDSDFIVDALIGVGGSEDIRGLAKTILQKLQGVAGVKIAIDCPTGLNSLTGFANEFCFRADYTITMFSYKLGLLINRGPDYSGEVLVASLGVPNFIVKEIANTYAFDAADIEELLPKRQRISSKFDYGRVLIIAGSERYPGAACLAANASIKSGAGLTILASTSFHPALLPEVIRLPLPATATGAISEKAYSLLREELEKADSIAIGPGLTDNRETISLVAQIISEFQSKKQIVVDADGLRAISSSLQLTKNIVLTPHSGELSRIIGQPREELERSSYFIAKEWAKRLGCNIHLKYVPSVTTDGEITYLCLAGNPGLATGGSGDVLTGIIATLLARGLEPILAASLGAYIHSLAGDYYSRKFGMETLTASALIDFLPEVL